MVPVIITAAIAAINEILNVLSAIRGQSGAAADAAILAAAQAQTNANDVLYSTIVASLGVKPTIKQTNYRG